MPTMKVADVKFISIVTGWRLNSYDIDDKKWAAKLSKKQQQGSKKNVLLLPGKALTFS